MTARFPRCHQMGGKSAWLRLKAVWILRSTATTRESREACHPLQDKGRQTFPSFIKGDSVVTILQKTSHTNFLRKRNSETTNVSKDVERWSSKTHQGWKKEHAAALCRLGTPSSLGTAALAAAALLGCTSSLEVAGAGTFETSLTSRRIQSRATRGTRPRTRPPPAAASDLGAAAARK